MIPEQGGVFKFTCLFLQFWLLYSGLARLSDYDIDIRVNCHYCRNNFLFRFYNFIKFRFHKKLMRVTNDMALPVWNL